MTEQPHGRRSFLMGMGSLGISRVIAQDGTSANSAGQGGSVLGPGEGEHLVHFRDGGDIFIRVSAANGSIRFAQGTQQVMKGTGIPVHRHFQMDEAFHVLAGSGVVSLNDVRHEFSAGSSIFIPRNTWHGFENPDHELLVLWTVAPAGLDGFFRETCSPAGAPPKGLSRQQIGEIARKYGTEFR